MKKWPLFVAGFFLLLLLPVQPVFSQDEGLIIEANQYFKPLPEVMSAPADNPATKEQGRFHVTKNDQEKYFFKVPLWRNVTRTAPYFHDGSVWALKEAVRIMGSLQLGKELTREEIDLITEFLHSLEGRIPEEALRLPILPASTPATPRPVFK